MADLSEQRILMLTENFPPIEGGSGRWFWELYSRLPKDNVLIVAHNAPGAREFDKTHELNIIRMPLQSLEWGFKSLIGLAFYWRTVRALKKIIKQHKITHVHCGRVIHEGVAAWLLNKITNIKYLCYVHGEDVETAAISREHTLLVRAACKSSEVLICNSENSVNLVEKLNFAQRSKCEILHPGADTERFTIAERDEEFRKDMGWAGKSVFLTVGRLQKRKGQDMMIKAMPALLQQFPNLFYAIVGRGECLSELEQLIEDLHLTDHVRIYSGVDDEQMIQCYQQCDIFILPNRSIGGDIEGFGMVLVEAQACGKPVVAGMSGGTRETMAVGTTGLVIDCTNPESINVELSNFLSDKERILSMSDTARDFVVRTFDWSVHVDKALRLFVRDQTK